MTWKWVVLLKAIVLVLVEMALEVNCIRENSFSFEKLLFIVIINLPPVIVRVKTPWIA